MQHKFIAIFLKALVKKNQNIFKIKKQILLQLYLDIILFKKKQHNLLNEEAFSVNF